ncbi:terminase small subunit [Geobacillus stearothermophilus]|uniref:terminase small subunit n=1 Tax=Geobacillus stearothermophilus TaxID=1422 RepID=UPI000779CBF7|nr:terminase small subunit [Geobacillus stearothermophilus]
MKLTPKQKAFADYYIELGNAEEAARKAGYSDATARGHAHRLLQNVAIRQYIDERIAEKDSKQIAKQDEILSFLTQVMRGEVTERIPIVGKDFFEVVDNTPNIKDRVKAAELLGKRYALWTEKQQVEVTTPVFVDDVPEDD